MNYKKSYENTNNEVILYAQDKYGFTHDIANYIYNLGYKTIDQIEKYINPTNEVFHNPFLFPDMRKVVDKINNAIKEKKKILIYGDYDVDGIGSTYILMKYFEEIGVKVDYFLPSRYKDGYGLTIGSIDKVINEYAPDLIITVDCGITSVNEVEYLKQKGVDIIITDHHEPLETLPNCLILDCKIKDQPYPFRYLCGAGMALKLVEALSDEQTCKKYMTVCAISTISDIVELIDENRYIVKEGLKNFKEDCPEGVKYLIKQCKVFGTPTSKDISFKIAPKLNATGRMGDASISLKLYLAQTEAEIKKYCQKTMKMNEERQQLCNTIFDEAITLLEGQDELGNIIVLQKPEWECGILGIVSSKIVERYHKPTILFGFDERTQCLTGSARSCGSFDMHKAISQHIDLLTSFGGHKMACGVSLKPENFDNFSKVLQPALISDEDEEVNLYDIDLNPNQINMDFVNHLALLEPFGIANPEPLFRVKVASVTVSPMPSHFDHLIVEIEKSSGVYFNHAQSIYSLSFNNKKHLFINLNKEYFLSKPVIKSVIKDYECKEFVPFNRSISLGAYNVLSLYSDLQQEAIYSTDYKYNKYANTVYVSFLDKYPSIPLEDVCYVNYVPSTSMRTQLVSPIDFKNLDDVEELVFMEDLPNDAIIKHLNTMYPSMKIFANIEKQKSEIKLKLADFSRFYDIVKKILEDVFDQIYLFKKYFSKLNFSFTTFICIYKVLQETAQLNFDNKTYKLQVSSSLDLDKIKEYCNKYQVVLE